MTPEEIKTALEDLPGWKLVEVDQMLQLEKAYSFKDFAEALAFTNQVGALAEKEDHHPALLTEWGKVTLNWWSHSAKGVTENDLKLAAMVEELTRINPG